MRLPEPSGVVALITDFGLSDGYVAAMKGVVLGINPGATLVDITHEVEPHDIAGAGYVLGSVYRYFPAGTVFLAVVDPGVGGERRPIVAVAETGYFVGPDNGLFGLIYSAEPVCEVYCIREGSRGPSPVSDTFHGRDIFAPVAARLSLGDEPGKLGHRIDDYARGDFRAPVEEGGKLKVPVVHVDRFGNLVTSLSREGFAGFTGGREFVIRAGGRVLRRVERFYSAVNRGELLALFGSSGTLEISVNQGSAAEVTGLKRGALVEIELTGG